ncbi:MAG: glycosyltransferase family 4 protein [Silvibacterium sp.]|nr:glycosyltransferase family 4 protein [Silvibacterium sp.]
MHILQAANGVFHHFELARQLDAQGHSGQIFSTYPWRRLKREGLPKSRVRTFPWVHTPQIVADRYRSIPDALNRRLTLATFRTFDRWVARNLVPCDAYVALSSSGLVSGPRAQQLGARYVCDRGSSHIRYQDEVVREEMRRWGIREEGVDPLVIEREEAEYAQADAVTVPSEFAWRSFLEKGFPRERLRRIPLGVRLEFFKREGEPPAGTFDVLFVGSVTLRKGVPYLIQGFQKLRYPNKRLRLVGSIPDEIRPILARLDMGNVELLGVQSQSDVRKFMSTSHVMVLPSIEDGWGMVMGQAMACGCPVISSDHTGGPDLYSHGVEGFIVPIRSADAIAEGLQQLADNPELRQSMSEAALKRVRSLGGWDDYGRQYAAFLKELAAN